MTLLPLIEKLVSEAESGNTTLCMSVTSKVDESKWLQITWDHLNCAFPFSSDLMSVLDQHGICTPESWEVVGVQPGVYATWEHDSIPREVSDFATRYAIELLDMSLDTDEVTVLEEIL